MFSIGQLARQSGVKIPTIRYYEQAGLMPEPERSAGNQRRYDRAGLERLCFIKHGRDLGFSLEAIGALIGLQEHPDHSCASAREIAAQQLEQVREKRERLERLERELARIAAGCDGQGRIGECYVLAALSNHQLCEGDH